MQGHFLLGQSFKTIYHNVQYVQATVLWCRTIFTLENSYRELSTKLHGITFQKTVIFLVMMLITNGGLGGSLQT